MKRSNSILRTCVLTTAGSLCTVFALPVIAQTTLVDLRSQTKGVDFSKASATKPFKTGTALPATCTVGDSFFKTDAASGQNLYGCTAVNTWTVESGGGLPALTGNADHLLGTDGSLASWVALGGDLSGAPQTILVNGLQGRHVAATTPTDGQVLRWNSSAVNWEPGTVVSSSGTSTSNTGGDLTGLVSNATVTRMQNKPVSSLTPSDGQVLTWNSSSGQWQPQAPAAGTGSGSGSSGTAISSALSVTYSSANTITIGAGCSLSAPCNVRFGNNVLGVTNSYTVTWQSGSGTVFIYVSNTGAVTVGTTLTVTCSTGCQVASGTSSFPVNSIPLFTWSAVPGGWDPAGGHDLRAYLSSKILSAGTGVILVESGQQSTVGVDTTLIPTYTTGSGNLAFGSIAATACSADIALSVPGAVTGDAVAPGWPSSLPAGVIGMMRVTAANAVSVRLCNLGSTASTVASASFRATVVRGL
jgi:hypothetical protein